MANTRNDAGRIKLAMFHAPRHDGLYQPIAFLFVTERMRADILAEREMILAAQDEAERKRQANLFARYDPGLSVKAFNTILDLFHLPHPPETDTAPTPPVADVAAVTLPGSETRPARTRRRKPAPPVAVPVTEEPH